MNNSNTTAAIGKVIGLIMNYEYLEKKTNRVMRISTIELKK
jgi:hypothetical protein